jgi:hypothetical protein
MSQVPKAACGNSWLNSYVPDKLPRGNYWAWNYHKPQAASAKLQATSLTKQDSGTIKDVERINYYGKRKNN